MSFDIDMENYAGGRNGPAAVDQTTGPNTYNQEAEDYPVDLSLVEKPVAQAQEAPLEKEEPQNSNPQADNFRALREEVDRIKAEKESDKREYQLQLDLLKANLSNQNKPTSPEPKKMFEGMKDDDVPNVAELRQEWERKESGYQARLEELQVQQMFPDYAEVIEKFALPLVKSKPHLAEGINGASNKAMYAYELGKLAQGLQAQQTQQVQQKIEQTRSQNAERIVENSKKPGTLSQAGGQSTLSKADYFASMSDQEFMKMANKNLEGI